MIDRVKNGKNVTMACYGPLPFLFVRKETKTKQENGHFNFLVLET